MFGRLVVIVALVASSATVNAQVDPGSFDHLDWRLVGPFRGGRVLAAAGVPGQPQHFYFGSVNGGVWESRDAGRTWQPIFDDQPIGSIGALAIAPSDPNVIYVGSGEADMRSDIAQGDGMYKSLDAGKSWHKIGLEDSQQIGRIIIDPVDANRVYVAALGHAYGPNEQRGVFRSTDGGTHWSRILGNDDATGAIDLAFEPGNPNIIYAAMWQARRTPWNVYPPASGPGSGLYKSVDGGDSWQPIRGNGFPEGKLGRIGVSVAPNMPNRVYAIVDGDAGGLYRSDDAGVHWKRTSSDNRIWNRGWYFGRITIDPTNADRVYVLNTIVLRSDDGGSTFIPLKGDNTGDDFHDLWIDPSAPQRRILAVDQGAIVSVNGGETWSSWHNQPTAQMYHIITDDRFPYRIYGAQQDSGAIALPSRGNSRNGITMMQFREVTAGGESGMIAPDPRDPDIIYGGRVDKLDLRTEQTRSIDPTLAEPDLYRNTWTLPLAFDARDPGTLYYGNQKIWRTRDGGEHWQAISPDLTRENPAVPANLDKVTAANNLGNGPRRGVVYAIASSPLKDQRIWAGTDDGLIWRTDNAGEHWNNVTPKALTAWSKVGIIEPSHFNADGAYVAIDRHRLDDRKPYIYRTRDGGKNWQLIVNGIREGDFVNAVREDPKRKGLLYAATELGMYISFDDGDHWQTLQKNLPRTSVRDIDVHGDDLVIGTHGRGIWILDNISALRQLDTSTASTTRLFEPATAIRYREAEFTGTPLPKDEPMAANPKSGAYIDYRLAVDAKAPVRLVIKDAGGNPIRQWHSTDIPDAIDLSRIGSAPEWVEQATPLATAKGMHRFIWSLHYPSATDVSNPYADGIWAPPGRYSAELTVDGMTYTQSFNVVADPRIDLPDSAYQASFELARKIEALQVRISNASEEASALRKSLAEKRASTADAASRMKMDSFETRLNAITGSTPAPNPFNAWSVPPKSTQTLTWLERALGQLLAAVDGADAMPSADSRMGYEKLTALVDTTIEEWKRISSDTSAH
ncbi:MAG TPA: hypothetical protein VFN25_12690 [Dokdonella sp.]|uniref:WD40/YVTN/BNR-like repeat-containing protein n=1 Tax=Dokdonella sp. TaxID=2291710 RepID=UPI002D7E48A0|nr:hypothetical protein [Dokdonella sp.]HET9033749.1 hypothetical protein [Dokdonella sp.]